MRNLAESRCQVTEIWQRAGGKHYGLQPVCSMSPAKFLLKATCHLLNEAAGGRA
jgi:pyruvate/2-oxoglutarate/acetoin dehydrogenase E1 component